MTLRPWMIAGGVAVVLFVLQMWALFRSFAACAEGMPEEGCIGSLSILTPLFFYLPVIFPSLPAVPTWVAFPVLIALDIGAGALVAWAVVAIQRRRTLSL